MQASDGPLSHEMLKSAVHDMLTSGVEVPDDAKGATFVMINHDKVEVVVATKLVRTEKVAWDVNVVASHEYSGENQIGVLSKITWK